MGCMVLPRQHHLEGPSATILCPLKKNYENYYHVAAYYSVLHFSYVTKPKIKVLLLQSREGGLNLSIQIHNKGWHYIGFVGSRLGRDNACFTGRRRDLTLAGAGTRRQAFPVLSWAPFPPRLPCSLLSTVSPLLGHGKAAEPPGNRFQEFH